MDKAQTMQHHTSPSFARRHSFVLIGHETFVHPVNQPSVCDHSSDQAEVIETLDAHLFQVTTLP
jgi:hypothetical protein